MSRRRRALLLGGLAVVLGGLAAFNVAGREAALQARVGGLVDVVVASKPIAAGEPVRARALAVRRVPAHFAPRSRIASPRALKGLRAQVDIARDTDLTPALVGDGSGRRSSGPAFTRGERIAEIVALGSPMLVSVGSRVDVLVTPEPASNGPEEAFLALEDVEVVAASAVADDDGPSQPRGAEPSPGTRIAASLRVTLRQALYLAAAQDFARELRLLPRAAGDRARGRAGMRAGPRLP